MRLFPRWSKLPYQIKVWMIVSHLFVLSVLMLLKAFKSIFILKEKPREKSDFVLCEKQTVEKLSSSASSICGGKWMEDILTPDPSSWRLPSLWVAFQWGVLDIKLLLCKFMGIVCNNWIMTDVLKFLTVSNSNSVPGAPYFLWQNCI